MSENKVTSGTTSAPEGHLSQSEGSISYLPGFDPDGASFDYEVRGDHNEAVWLRGNLGVGRMSNYFRMGTKLVYTPLIGKDGYIYPDDPTEDNGLSTITEFDGLTLSTRVNDKFSIGRRSKDGTMKPCWFPTEACTRVLKTLDEAKYLRKLVGVTHTPMALPGGGVLTEPGFDDETGYLYQPSVEVPAVPTKPTSEQVDAATKLLRGMVDEFKWDGKHDEANFLGALLTPLLRLVTPPPYQLLAIMSRERGSGKSLLAKVLKEVHGGATRAWPTTEEEITKTFASVLVCTTGPVVVFDNVRGMVKSAKLENMLTSRYSDERLLGSTNNAELHNDRLWVMTGNNLTLAGDMDRRTLWCTIDPGVPNPEERTGFKLDLPQYVEQHRGDILHALLTWIAYWDHQGRPVDEGQKDDFGAWIMTVRSILDLAGVPGEFGHKESRQTCSNEEDTEWGEFLSVLHRIHGEDPWRTGDVVTAITEYQEDRRMSPDGRELLEALPSELHAKAVKSGSNIAKSLGWWCRNHEGQWVDGLAVRKVRSDKKHGITWQVVEAAVSDDSV